MKKNPIWKAPKFSVRLLALVVILGLATLYSCSPRRYFDSSYQRDYLWNGIEVGTIFRLPLGSAIPNGRYGAVIAFPAGKNETARILLEGPKGELPTRPKFVSGQGQTVVYALAENDTRTIDLTTWQNFPARSLSSTGRIGSSN